LDWDPAESRASAKTGLKPAQTGPEADCTEEHQEGSGNFVDDAKSASGDFFLEDTGEGGEQRRPEERPEKHAGYQHREVNAIAPDVLNADARECGSVGEQCQWIHEGEKERGEVHPRFSVGPLRWDVRIRTGSKRVKTQSQQKNPAYKAKPLLMARDEIGDERDAERRNDGIDNIRRGAAQSYDEAAPAAARERTSDAEDSDRPYRCRERESNDDTFEKTGEGHTWRDAPVKGRGSLIQWQIDFLFDKTSCGNEHTFAARTSKMQSKSSERRLFSLFRLPTPRRIG
jgi:hypothetical protein